jgi:hypothetical protein
MRILKIGGFGEVGIKELHITNRWSSPPGFLLHRCTSFCRGPSVADSGRLLNSMLERLGKTRRRQNESIAVLQAKQKATHSRFR